MAHLSAHRADPTESAIIIIIIIKSKQNKLAHQFNSHNRIMQTSHQLRHDSYCIYAQ